MAAFIAPIGLLTVRINRWRNGAGKKQWGFDLAVTVGVMVALPFLALGVSYWLFTFVALYDLAASPDVEAIRTVSALLGATLLVSACLFWFRLKCQFLYGCSEACVGVLVALLRILSDAETAQVSTPQFLLLLLTAGVYLIVQGFDNMHKGATKTPADPVWSYLMARSRQKS